MRRPTHDREDVDDEMKNADDDKTKQLEKDTRREDAADGQTIEM